MFRKLLWGVSRHGRKVFQKTVQRDVPAGAPCKQAELVKACHGQHVRLSALQQTTGSPKNQLLQAFTKYARKNMAGELRRQFDKSPLYREYRGLANKLSLFAFVGVGFGSKANTEMESCVSLCHQIKDLFQSKNVDEAIEPCNISCLEDCQLGPMIAKGCSAAVYQAKNINFDHFGYNLKEQEVNQQETVISDDGDDTDIEVISEDEEDFSMVINTNEKHDNEVEASDFEHVFMDLDSQDGITVLDSESCSSDNGADVMFLVTCERDEVTCSNEIPIQKDVDSEADFNLAIKMMFNYDVESNASALYREMQKELTPLQISCDPELATVWDTGHRAKEKKRLPPHPNIVEMKTAFVDNVPALPGCQSEYPHALPQHIHPEGLGRNKTLFVVMKRYPQTLRQYLASHELSVHESLCLMSQLVEAVTHMVHHGVAHRDLKSDNIFVDDSDGSLPRLVVSDFGECVCSLRIPYICEEISKGGNMTLMAPEIRNACAGRRSFLDYTKADLWTVGALAYEIFGQSNPFYTGCDGRRLSSDTYREEDLPTLPDKIPAVVQQIIGMLLLKDPCQRPTAHEVSTMLHVILWCPQNWINANQAEGPAHTPSTKEIMRWLLILFAQVSCEKALGRTGVHHELRRHFLKHLDFGLLILALEEINQM